MLKKLVIAGVLVASAMGSCWGMDSKKPRRRKWSFHRNTPKNRTAKLSKTALLEICGADVVDDITDILGARAVAQSIVMRWKNPLSVFNPTTMIDAIKELHALIKAIDPTALATIVAITQPCYMALTAGTPASTTPSGSPMSISRSPLGSMSSLSD